MIPRTIVAAGAALALASCTQGPNGPEIGPRTGAGAAIGTVVGAVTGAVIAKDDAAGAIVGGAIGAAVGAGIGAELDRQQRELERNLKGTGATVVNTGEELLVNLPESVTFAFDSAEVRREFMPALRDVGDTLTEFPNSEIDVIGHTDSIGTEAYNQRLSERRARAVARVLAQSGVQRRRMQVFGEGETRPVASNETEAGRAENRRVELIIVPTGEG